MKRKTVFTLIVGLMIFASPSWAQRGKTGTTGSASEAPHRFEIIPMGGYVWTVSRSTTYNSFGGDVDLDSGGFWGVAVDINAVSGIQGRLLYRRQDTNATFKRAGTKENLGDIAVEYWHVGAVKAVAMKDNVMPFTSFSLGGTRYAVDAGDEWKF